MTFRKAQKAHHPEDHERWEEDRLTNTIAGHGTSSDLTIIEAWPEQAMPLMERDYKGPRNYRDGGIQAMCVQSVPRRLTPTECERLQGFPDGWTAWGLDEDGERVELKDAPRYRQMGNAVTVNVAEWIGRRIIAVETGAPMQPCSWQSYDDHDPVQALRVQA